MRGSTRRALTDLRLLLIRQESLRICPVDFERIGRARLMMRLPRYRKQLSELNFLALTSLFESYGVAVTTRDGLSEDEAMQESACRAIEEKVVRLLIDPAKRL